MKNDKSVSIEKYDKLLLKTAEIKANLAFTVKELELKIKEISELDLMIISYASEITDLKTAIDKMKEYIKYLKKELKKQKRKAWFNGVWQGFMVGVAVIVLVLIL